MKLNPYFYTRAGAAMPLQYSWLPVISASWAAIGGPEKARLGGFNARRLHLPELINLLRCPVELQAEDGSPSWWGYVHGFEYWSGPVGVTCSLDDMLNRVRVHYSSIELTPLSGWTSQSAYTGWADWVDSQTVYGIRECILRLQAATSAEATAARNLAIDAHGWPEVKPAVRKGQAGEFGGNIFLDLRGWWDTAGWRYYEQSAGLVENMGETGKGYEIGGTSTASACAECFTTGAVPWRVETIWIRCKKSNSPTDGLTVSIYSNDSDEPDSSLGGATVAYTDLQQDFRWTAFVFSSPVSLAANTKYWIHIARSGDAETTQYYEVYVDEGLCFAGGSLLVNRAGWIPKAVDADLIFRMLGGIETSEQIKLMAAASCGGALLGGLRVDVSSGVFSNPYRIGDYPARKEIEDLLRAGTSAGARLLARVERDKLLKVYTQPADTTAVLQVDPAGAICDRFGNPLPAWASAAGEWAVVDSAWAGQGSGSARIKDRVLLERVEWDAGAGVMRPG